MNQSQTLLLTLLLAPALAQAQPPELDLTITVMEAGETPSGLIQRLELPPVDQLLPPAAPGAAAPVPVEPAQLPDAAAAQAGEAADRGVDAVNSAIRERLSIEGTNQAAAPGSNVPGQVVDILDQDLPLQNPLQELPRPGDGTGATPPVALPDLPGAAPNPSTIVDNLTPAPAATLPDVQLPESALPPPQTDTPAPATELPAAPPEVVAPEAAVAPAPAEISPPQPPAPLPELPLP